MMTDDALLEDDDLLEESALLDDELLDDTLLDEENDGKNHSPIKHFVASPADISREESPVSDSAMKNDNNDVGVMASSSKDTISSVEALENEQLDYEDDLDDLDERRESKFSSERTNFSKPTNINEILPQQKNSKSYSDDASSKNDSSRGGRGGYRGRYNNNRGVNRGRAGFRNAAPFPFPSDGIGFLNNGAGIFPNVMGMPGMGLPFNPNVPPPTLPSQVEAANWNRRVEAFVRQTAGSGNLSSRSRSYSGSSSCSTCSSRSRSPLTSRRNDTRKERRSRTPEKRKPVDDVKTSRECAAAIGLDEEYLKKVEEQKQKREELQRKKALRFQDTRKSEEPDVKRRRDKSPQPPPRARERSADRDSRRKHHRHHHSRRHHSKGHRSSSLERLAQQAMESINQAAKPTVQFPSVPTSTALPPMNVPPPPLPISTFSQPPPAIPPPVVPTIRTVSTAVVGRPDQPQVIMQAPPPDAKEKKLKARLVVVVSNIRTLQNAFKRISLFATSVGVIKKAWQPTENEINLIFDQLDDAKKFLTQYHHFNISNIRLVVALHKMYLNLETIP